jgi:thiamine biosynthesis lipoprotein
MRRMPPKPGYEPAPAGYARPGHVRVERLMGTVFSFDVRDPQVPEPILDAICARLRAIEDRFSPFRSESELRRLWRGEIEEAACSPEMRRVLALADSLAQRTDGAFDARRWRADGQPDPTGLVKGWAAEVAATSLREAGAANFALNAGGDVVIVGEASPGQAWRVGLRDPSDASRVVATLAVRGMGVATSGLYERGDHIRDPRNGAVSQSPWLSMTVAGPDLALADAYATAALVLGEEGPAFVDVQAGYGAYGLHRDGRAYWTEAMTAWLVS